MSNDGSQPEETIDIRLLARQDLPHEAFPGGSNEGFRVFFSPEVHRALWQHARANTSVEICGVLVGTWHRDQAGPFVKVVESIRGEGAETRFAEVTFTHETWAKINSQMDTTFAKYSIVGWYHTHPDFGIFLSDRDRFIQEHFFSGPGQVAHVIDPIRKIEGVFIWRDGKPAKSEHFWVGDRILTSPADPAAPAAGSQAAHGNPPRAASTPPVENPAPAGRRRAGDRLPPPSRLALYGAIFLLGYLLSNILSAWEHQRFVETEIASNNFVAILRLGLADELDNVNGDLAAVRKALTTARSDTAKNDEAIALAHAESARAARRVQTIKSRYANTPVEDEMLRRLLRDQVARLAPPKGLDAAAGPSTSPEPSAAPAGAAEAKAPDSGSGGKSANLKVEP